MYLPVLLELAPSRVRRAQPRKQIARGYVDASVRMTHMGPGCTAGLCEKGVTFSLDYLQFFAGDDAHAKEKVGALIEQPGFFGIDLGLPEAGGRLVQIPGGPLPVLNLVKLG